MSFEAMAEPATRVVLLACQGVARERLHAALQQAGADVVLIADPSETDADSVRRLGVQAILVALEPSVEDALDQYGALLADPAITVIFDEAELAVQREGWDAARWTRHLAAKLNRHHEVLPPGAEIESALAAEAQPLNRYQRPDSDGDISAFTGEADVHMSDVPRDFTRDASPSTAASMFDPVLAELDIEVEPQPKVFSAPALDRAEPHQAADDHSTSERFRRDLDSLELRIADMELEDIRPTRSASQDGAVVVLAGIGGPDAVRQLLGALPAAFPRPVLIQQRLEGGRHDKLVRQMQRATAMPVSLAEPGEALQRGHVYVLPADLGIGAEADGLHFRAGGSDDLVASLPSADSAVIVLSGTDPALVDAAMAHAFRGALVAGQSPEGCFDATASDVLVARGAEAGAPAQLAKKLAMRWPS
jgi:chemosensory pili system protein ChpB (putative protein-glutamate methylesterase)